MYIPHDDNEFLFSVTWNQSTAVDFLLLFSYVVFIFISIWHIGWGIVCYNEQIKKMLWMMSLFQDFWWNVYLYFNLRTTFSKTLKFLSYFISRWVFCAIHIYTIINPGPNLNKEKHFPLILIYPVSKVDKHFWSKEIIQVGYFFWCPFCIFYWVVGICTTYTIFQLTSIVNSWYDLNQSVSFIDKTSENGCME